MLIPSTLLEDYSTIMSWLGNGYLCGGKMSEEYHIPFETLCNTCRHKTWYVGQKTNDEIIIGEDGEISDDDEEEVVFLICRITNIDLCERPISECKDFQNALLPFTLF